MKVTSITKAAARDIISAVNEALEPLAAKYDLAEIKSGNATIESGGTALTIKIHCKVKAENNPQIDAVNTELSRMYGYSDNIVGKKFLSSNRDEYLTITGINSGRPKWPILATDSSGRSFKLKAGVKVDGVTYDHSKDLSFGHHYSR